MKTIVSSTILKLIGVAFVVVLLLSSVVQAANPATITVTVTVQNISVSATGPIAFGSVATNSTTINATSSTVTNNGNVAETYSLSLTNPGGWTAVQADPSAAEQYCLSAIFNSDEPTGGDFAYSDHALSTSSVASSGSKFAGDETGISVAAAATRTLWLQFEAPTSTSVTAEQSITVTVTAAAS